jgi:hypothetical protein
MLCYFLYPVNDVGFSQWSMTFASHLLMTMGGEKCQGPEKKIFERSAFRGSDGGADHPTQCCKVASDRY